MDRRRQTLDELLEEVAGTPPSEHGELLRRMALVDPEQADEVAALLQYIPSAHALLTAIFSKAFPPMADHEAPRCYGAYRVVRHIASGGMGSVYEAVGSGRRVAVKVARTSVRTASWVQQLWREAEILASLCHPNIVPLLDRGTASGGVPYFVMEYVDGEPLTSYVQARRPSLARRIEIFRGVCAAVECAHRNRVIHCDLKQANILIRRNGDPVLLDFGVARRMIDPDDAEAWSWAAFLTPDCCAPEQLMRGRISVQTDVFQLGLLLSKLNTPERDRRLAGIVTRATQMDAGRRYANVVELVADL